VPVRSLRAAGVPVALGADDPLLFRSGCSTSTPRCAPARARRRRAGRPGGLRRTGERGAADLKAEVLAGIEEWLAAAGAP
jgi:adenosine deaminase